MMTKHELQQEAFERMERDYDIGRMSLRDAMVFGWEARDRLNHVIEKLIRPDGHSDRLKEI